MTVVLTTTMMVPMPTTMRLTTVVPLQEPQLQAQPMQTMQAQQQQQVECWKKAQDSTSNQESKLS